jgi:hypothetical protein
MPLVEVVQRRESLQARPHGPLGLVLVGYGVAEVDQQPITQVLGNVAVIALDHSGAALLIRLHQLAQLFGVKLFGEGSGTYEVTEHHGELAALSFGSWCDGVIARQRGGW